MAAVQLMCARLGMVTGRGLGGVIRKRYPPWVLWLACLLLIVANVFNIGADLGGMADAMHMVTGIQSYVWTPFFAILITALLIWASYQWIARVFKWLTLVLFAYVITAFLAHPDWSGVLRSTFIPHMQWTRDYMSVLVGILGTTISPYLFFWQASQEVETETAQGRTTLAEREGATDEELSVARTDTDTGMFYSNLVMYFIILTTAATLHAHRSRISRRRSRRPKRWGRWRAKALTGSSRWRWWEPACWPYRCSRGRAPMPLPKRRDGISHPWTSARGARRNFMA